MDNRHFNTFEEVSIEDIKQYIKERELRETRVIRIETEHGKTILFIDNERVLDLLPKHEEGSSYAGYNKAQSFAVAYLEGYVGNWYDQDGNIIKSGYIYFKKI